MLVDAEAPLTQWQRDRRARAAVLWVEDGALRWAGSRRLTLVFARRAEPQLRGDTFITFILPFERLEAALELAKSGDTVTAWRASGQGLSEGWLGEAEVLYDPARVLTRLQRPPSAEEWAARLLAAAENILAQPTARGGAAALQELLRARHLAAEYLYPALAARQGLWPRRGVRAAHYWRAQLSLTAPRALEILERLYGFGGEAQAHELIAALQGLGMLEWEQQARLALREGYSDGVIRWLRDEVAEKHAGDLARWLQLSAARRERLSLLLGLERSPLGAAALDSARELLAEARINR